MTWIKVLRIKKPKSSVSSLVLLEPVYCYEQMDYLLLCGKYEMPFIFNDQ